MSRLGVLFLSCLSVWTLPRVSLTAAETRPDFREVYSVIESNLPAGISKSELNSLALKSLISALDSRVAISQGNTPPNDGTTNEAVSKAEMLGTMAYIRIGKVNGDLPEAASRQLKQLQATNKVQGVVLDLRYANGLDYQAAADTADLFVADQKPLLDWGDGMVTTKAKGALINVPQAVLINNKTAGAAEALAATLRDTGTGLLLGERSAGLAAAGKEFPLSTGQRLRINVRPIRLGSGATIPPSGVTPDISVEINPEDEQVYYADPYARLTKTNTSNFVSGQTPQSGTNRAARKFRMNEAELVREHNEGRMETARREAEPEQRSVTDPVLARALDVLKGLALVRQRG